MTGHEMDLSCRCKSCTSKVRRIKAEINKWSQFCNLEPDEFTNKDVKQIAEYAGVSVADAWDYINHWYLD